MPTPIRADIAVVGLGVMGQNLALNMADHGFVVGVFEREEGRATRFASDHPAGSFGARGGGLLAAGDPRALVAALSRPRRMLMMIKAGPPTDWTIDLLAPLLETGDILIDGGNAHWEDTTRREKSLAAKGLRFVGCGVSGGEEGARYGPSLMAGGAKEAWDAIAPVWTAIAAKVDPTTGKPLEGAGPGRPIDLPGAEPCAAWVGPGAAGHFVKMVHNGIEYADMQLIAEAYHLLREVGGLSPAEMAPVFARWNRGDLDSFLIEITADLLAHRDGRSRGPFVDAVLDAAGQKGTGKWTSTAALDLGLPAMSIAEAVFARAMSALKEERVAASRILKGPSLPHQPAVPHLDDAVRASLYSAKICAYAQGFQLLAAASRDFGWGLDFGTLAMIWRGGCIIRARFLQKIKEAYGRAPGLANLLLDPYFAGQLEGAQGPWRRVVSLAATAGVPIPAMSSALAYYDSYRCATLPANLIQAQRDYFGAHTYERTDQPRGRFFHTDWPDAARPEREA